MEQILHFQVFHSILVFTIEAIKKMIGALDGDTLGKLPIVLISKPEIQVFIAAKREDLISREVCPETPRNDPQKGTGTVILFLFIVRRSVGSRVILQITGDLGQYLFDIARGDCRTIDVKWRVTFAVLDFDQGPALMVDEFVVP
jgi:hypothetical protein